MDILKKAAIIKLNFSYPTLWTIYSTTSSIICWKYLRRVCASLMFLFFSQDFTTGLQPSTSPPKWTMPWQQHHKDNHYHKTVAEKLLKQHKDHKFKFALTAFSNAAGDACSKLSTSDISFKADSFMTKHSPLLKVSVLSLSSSSATYWTHAGSKKPSMQSQVTDCVAYIWTNRIFTIVFQITHVNI